MLQLLEEKKTSKLKISQKAKVPYSTFLEILNGKFLPNADVQKRLAASLEIDLRIIQEWVAEDKINKNVPELLALSKDKKYQINKESKELFLQEQPSSYQSSTQSTQLEKKLPATTKLLSIIDTLSTKELQEIEDLSQKLLKKKK